MTLGKLFAIHGQFKIKGNLILLPALFILMVGELFITHLTDIYACGDAFFSLPLFAFAFINCMLGIDCQNERFIVVAKKLKEVGSFSYLFHLQFFGYVYWICDAAGRNVFMENYWLLAALVLLCIGASFGLQTLCEWLSRHKGLRFLRYSY